MSSSTDSNQKTDRRPISRGAVIRPVNRRNGEQRYIRIDPVAENVVKPKTRSLKLDDYIAQIRGEHSAAVRAEAVSPVVEEISIQQKSTTDQLSHADQVNVLQALAKLDAGYEWIANNNRSAALESMDISEQIAASAPIVAANEDTGLVDLEDSAVSPVSQDLVNSIATAIASVLTEKPETALNSKIKSTTIRQPHLASHTRAEVHSPSVGDAHDNSSEDSFRLSPALPRREYTLPVTEHELPAEEEPVREVPFAAPSNATQPIKPVSLTAAAWTVPAFRWPKVSDLILSHDGIIGGLATNCEEILSPFGKTIAVTAPSRGQGTSTMSITLARLLASSKKRVLLVDADITNPTLSKTIGLEGVSWFSIDTPTAAVGECIIHGRLSDICVMPLGKPINGLHPHNVPVFDELETKLNQIKAEFDLIVVDAGPVWQIVDEISHNSQLIDVAMIVNQDTQSVGFSAARERLMDRGIFKFIAAQNSFARQAG